MTNIINNPPSRVGLVGEWLLDGNANDTSGNGLTGTNANGVYVKGNRGYVNQAWQGNGTNARIQCSDNAVFPSGGNYCINLWVKPITLPTSGNLVSIISKYDGTPNQGGYDIQLYNNSGTQQLNTLFNNSSGNGQINSNNYTLSTQNRSMITAILNGTSLSTYINGTPLSTTTVTGTPANNTKLLNIGAFGYYAPSAGDLGRYFNGHISLIRIYNRALSDDEIQLLYLEGQKRLGPTNTASYPKLFEGLVGYWDFRGSAHNLVNGSLPTTNTASLTTDRFGNSNSAYSFDGTNSAISHPNNTDLQLLGNYTYGGWFNSTTNNSIQRMINKDRAADSTGGYCLMINNNSGYQYYISHIGGGAERGGFTGVSVKPNGEWHHYIVRYDGATIKLYIDGIEVYSKNLTTNISGDATAPLIFGAYGSTPTGQWYNGKQGEKFIFNRALSADEVKLLYTLTSQDYIYPNPSYDLPSLRDGLVLDLNEQGKDLSGNGNHGTLVNAPTVVRQGKAKGLSYNGSNQYISMPSGFGNALGNSFTISFWIKPSRTSGNEGLMRNGISYGGSKNGWDMYRNPTNNSINFRSAYLSVIDNQLSTGNKITTGVWHFCVFTYNGTQSKWYYNGLLNDTQSVTGSITGTGDTNRSIGGPLSVDGANYFQGNLINPKVYNRALSDKEIQALYYSQKGNFIY